MNRRQRSILINFIAVMAVTAIAVVAMMNFRSYVNHSEAVRAMEHLGRIVQQYRQSLRQVPPESYVESIRGKLHGHARLGILRYRGRWIGIESGPDEILAYSGRNYHSLIVGSGVIVLRLDGRVEWMDKDDFEKLLAGQQSPAEIQLQQR